MGITEMKVAYIAAPFSAKNHWDVTLNVIEAKKVAIEVALLGVMPMCPHGNTESFHGTMTDEFWYEGTLELLKRCDAIVMHPNWIHSKGCKIEHAYAEENGMPIFYYSLDTRLAYTKFKDWADEDKVAQKSLKKYPSVSMGCSIPKVVCPTCDKLLKEKE